MNPHEQAAIDTPLARLIRTRRTTSAFTDQPVPVDLIIALLETAVWAPNHRLTEPWRFIILTGQSRPAYAEVRRRMVLETTPADDPARHLAADRVYAKFASIPAYLLVVQKLAAKPDVRDEDYAACAALIQNFLLLAWEQSLGTAWKTFKDHPGLRALFQLADDESVAGIIHIGYPAGPDRSTRQPAAGKITILDGR